MNGHWGFRKGRFLLLAVVAIAAFGLIVMLLWNWLMPALFGLKAIGYWQAVALLILSKILFSGFRGPWGGGGRWRERMLERYAHMTPEERERFLAGLRGPWARRHEPAPPTPPTSPTP